MKASSGADGMSGREPERMAVDPERAEDLRNSARQGGEADVNIGLIILVFLLAYAAWVLVSKVL